MRMLVAGLSEHLSVTLMDEGLGWHLSSWRLRRNAAAVVEPSAVARALLFPTAEAALGYFRGISAAPPPGAIGLTPVAPPVAYCHSGASADPAGVFAWIPEPAIAQALAVSWNLGLAISAIQGHRAGVCMQLTNGGVVYVVDDQPTPV